MRTQMGWLVVAVVVALAGCGAAKETVVRPDGSRVERPSADADYRAYLDNVAAAAQRRADREAERAATASALASQCGGDAVCVTSIGMALLLGRDGAGAGGGEPMPAAPAPKVSGWDRMVGVVHAVTPLAGIWAGVDAGRQNRRASVETARITWEGMRGIVGDTASAMGAVAAGAQPSITVGGDYVSGTQHHGDYAGRDSWSVGRDYTGGDRTDVGRDQIGRDQFQGPVAGGDQIGRDRIDVRARRIFSPGDERHDSPGPYDGDCREGADCSTRPIVPEPPTDEPEPDRCAPIPTWNGTQVVLVRPNIEGC